jgi:hypothetical protein
MSAWVLIRSASHATGELIEQGKWKRLAGELQAIARSALDPVGTER